MYRITDMICYLAIVLDEDTGAGSDIGDVVVRDVELGNRRELSELLSVTMFTGVVAVVVSILAVEIELSHW